MLFSCDYTREDFDQRPYLATVHSLVLFDQNNVQLGRVWEFNTDTGIGTRRDGTVVPVHHYGWYCHNNAERDRVLRYLPENQHALVHVVSLEEEQSGR